MELWRLFVAASVPVLKVLLLTAVGSFLATSRVNILVKDARKHLNLVTFFVFNPTLVYSSLSSTITFKLMVSLWFMPINILLTFLLGSLLGWAVIQITRAPSSLRSLIFGCCSAGNLGYMLIIIIPAICKEKHSPFGNPEVCNKLGLAYSSLSMALGVIFMWMYVYNIMRMSLSKKTTEDDEINGIPEVTPQPEALREQTSTMVSGSVKLITFLKKMSGKANLKKLLAPSTIGAIIGFIVGVIPPFRRALTGEGAPLRVIQDSAVLLGNGAIPTVILVMGGNLLRGFRGSEIRVPIIIGIIVVRYIALPLLGIAVVKGAIRFGLVHKDPLYNFILLLQFAVPPALNISTMAQLFGAGESECSVIFLWAYGLASVSLTLWSTFFMWLVS
ncbi:hypothetical protein CKAN_01141300 [Cinnamomum micranthum f. kanehirae]|uniref:Protein PIN-LIKES 3-like protein n=1 Tax=Cinnamomum micranthum f. kanehirae TaxID=337451 RepID=A0A3S3P4E5_9MAGN|nr:hypothetical protein CKAN_01141300 [Cinnamomum micranthum f. kanehirae]